MAVCILEAAEEHGREGWGEAISRLVDAINPPQPHGAAGGQFQFRPPAEGVEEGDGGGLERAASGASLGKRGARPEWEVDAVQVEQVVSRSVWKDVLTTANFQIRRRKIFLRPRNRRESGPFMLRLTPSF